MLQLIPAPLHRWLYRVADKARKRLWRIYRPRRRSVSVAAFDVHGQVLMVRHSYGRPVWALPGGGVGRNEDPELAAAREFREELGCELSDLVLIEQGEQQISGSRDQHYVFFARIAGKPRPDMREIVALDYFDPANLPHGCSRLVPPRVALATSAFRSSPASQEG